MRVSDNRDTIYLPSCNTSFELAIDAGTETEIMVDDPLIKNSPINIYAVNTYSGIFFNIEVSHLYIVSPIILTRIFFN